MSDGEVLLRRRAELPDRFRIERALRTPEYGPRILFFSGGSALRETSRALKRYTHNSIHLITPFDSGGSSAKLRDAFGFLSIGDLRNRLMALADDSSLGAEELTRLFARRLPKDEDQTRLLQRLESLASGRTEEMDELPRPIRSIAATHLDHFRKSMPESFDLRGASIGNLVLFGGLLFQQGDVDATLYLFSRLVKAKGIVLPVVNGSFQLRARLEDGRCIVGQHLLTGKEVPPISSPIVELDLVEDEDHERPALPQLRKHERRLIRSCDLLVFPVGSFYTSVLAGLLPAGVGQAVREARCPKIYIANAGRDPELLGKTLGDTVATLLATLRRDAGPDTATDELIDYLVLDEDDRRYTMELDLARVAKLGVKVVRVPLGGEDLAYFSPESLSELLVSLA